ncbi:MAG TPA: putative Ig domain-containing protein [Trebonia sp.]|jgi:hypothetical protein
MQMKYQARHTGPSPIVRIATRGGVIASAAAIAALGAAILAPGTAKAAPAESNPLEVTLSQSSDGAQAAFNAQGDITLKTGTNSSSTYAQAEVTDISDAAAPTTPPSFTTDNYTAGSPRWVLELANGNRVYGYPSQLGSGATDDFTGPQWEAAGTGVTDTHGEYETYQQALSDAGDANESVIVTHADLVADGDQAAGTVDTLTGVTYSGQTLDHGEEVVVSYPESVAGEVGTPVDVKPVDGGTNASDNVLTWTAAGLPPGLSINSATGEITGAPTAAEAYYVTVTATDVYGQTGSSEFGFSITPAGTFTAVGGTNSKVENVYSGKYLNVMADTYAPGSKLAQWDASGASHETFQYVTIKDSTGKVADGYLQAESPDGKWYYVTASGDDQLTLGAEVAHPSSAALAHVLVSNEDVEWAYGNFTFLLDTGHVADDSGWSTANGAPVIAYPGNGGKNQQWTMP